MPMNVLVKFLGGPNDGATDEFQFDGFIGPSKPNSQGVAGMAYCVGSQKGVGAKFAGLSEECLKVMHQLARSQSPFC